MENFKMEAKTFFGFEELLAKELTQLGAQQVELGTRMVSFVGDKGFMYKANLALRTAIKILKPIKTFKAYNDKSLYDGMMKIDWSEYMNEHQTFVFETTLHSEHFNHSQFVALKSKDAVVDQFRDKTGKRPNIDKDFPDVRLHIHIDRDVCTVSLDTSGESLHRRGYKSATNIAPINEVLAAGMLLLSGWDGQSHFLDPMCGSGTILAEAAMIACNIPVNINRKEFAFEKWSDWDSELFDKVLESLLKKTREFHYTITGYDKAPSAVTKAKDNIKNANLDEFIGVHHVNFFNSTKEVFGNTTILFNPPYGERLNIDVEEFYKKIGDTLKHNYPNSTAWLITSDTDALKSVGLRTSKRIALKNADLDCKFVKYELYEGSRKIKDRKGEIDIKTNADSEPED